LVSFLKRLAAKDNADVQWSVSAERICNVCKMRCAQSDGKAICPYCGSLDTYLSRYAHDAAWRETQNRRCDRRRVELLLWQRRQRRNPGNSLDSGNTTAPTARKKPI